VVYTERLSSKWTTALFAALTILFLALFAWRVGGAGIEALAVVLLVLALVFFFYTLNYRVLRIELTRRELVLTFGLFKWRLPLENIAAYQLDQVPFVMRYGGAGIHFMLIRGRYRASYNFLEYPRVVVALRRKAGPVCDLSFSTRRPDELLRCLQELLS
jgi:hypothetical protein